MVSDCEDENPGSVIRPNRVRPSWRSKELVECGELLDKITLGNADTMKKLKTHKETYGRGKTILRPTIGIVNVPQGLPILCYSQDWLASLNAVQLAALRVNQDVEMGEKLQKLRALVSVEGGLIL